MSVEAGYVNSMTDDRITQPADGAQPQGLQTAPIETAHWLSNLSYAATALEGSADNGDRYCARLIREHLAAVDAHRSNVRNPSQGRHAESRWAETVQIIESVALPQGSLPTPDAEMIADAILARSECLHWEPKPHSEPSEERIRLATLAAVKKGAKSDAEAVRNYREAERVIRAAIPHLGNSDECAPFDGPLPLCGYCGDRPGAPGCPAHGAPQGRPSDDDRIDAAARALNPQAWEVYDKASPGVDRDLIVDGSRAQARAALRAAGAVA